MRCRTTVGKSLLNLRPQLWPYGKHWSSCTIILSKQTAEGRSFWQKGHWVDPTTSYPITSFPGMEQSSKQKQPQANNSYRWISIKFYCCKNSSGPPTGHLKARAVSPRWDTVCCWGLFTLIWDERLPTTTRGIGRKYSGLTGFGGIKRQSRIWWSETWFWQWCEIWLREKRRQSDTEWCLCRAFPPVNQGRRKKV